MGILCANKLNKYNPYVHNMEFYSWTNLGFVPFVTRNKTCTNNYIIYCWFYKCYSFQIWVSFTFMFIK